MNCFQANGAWNSYVRFIDFGSLPAQPLEIDFRDCTAVTGVLQPFVASGRPPNEAMSPR